MALNDDLHGQWCWHPSSGNNNDDDDDDDENEYDINDDDSDDNDDADLKAQLARIDPAKIAGPLETAFQDVVSLKLISRYVSAWFRSKYYKT